jgi:hypothetical protein
MTDDVTLAPRNLRDGCLVDRVVVAVESGMSSPRLERLGFVIGVGSLSLRGLTLLGRSGEGCRARPGGEMLHGFTGVPAADGEWMGVLLREGFASICAMAWIPSRGLFSGG